MKGAVKGTRPFFPARTTWRSIVPLFLHTMIRSIARPNALNAARAATRAVHAPPAATRMFSSRAPFPRSTRPTSKSPPPGFFSRPIAVTTVSGSMLGFFTSSAPREIFGTTESGSIVREASPAAQLKQPYTLVFVSSGQLKVPRKEWQSWIMYFREAGYDCIDLNVELPKERPEGVSEEELLAREVVGQVRLSSLQRQPVLFIRDGGDKVLPSYLGTGGFFGRRGPMAGLVVLHPASADDVASADWPSNTPILIVPKTEGEKGAWEGTVQSARNASVLADEWNEKEGLVKEVERWMRNAGL